MQALPFSFPLVYPHQKIDDALISTFEGHLQEGDVVAISSKIVSLSEGCVVSKADISKTELIHREADAYLPGDYAQRYGHILTLKQGILIPSAGIDESNSHGFYLLYPQDPLGSAVGFWHLLRSALGLSKLGIVLTDSHTTPLRRGVSGIALSWCGFAPHYSYIGRPDLPGVPMKVTHSNLLDGLAATAVLVMGEGDEQTPVVRIRNAPKMHFLDRAPSEEEVQSVSISMEDDLYGPLFGAAPWEKSKA